MILQFDEREIQQRLGSLDLSLRLAFALACAERLHPTYVRYCSVTGWGDMPGMRDLLDRLWREVSEKEMSDSEQKQVLQECMSLFPGEQEPTRPESGPTEDAVGALAYAIRCLGTSDPQEAVWAARRGYEAVDGFVVARNRINISEPDSEHLILSDALIQRELSRQARDLAEIEGTKKIDAGWVDSLRRRAQSEPSIDW